MQDLAIPMAASSQSAMAMRLLMTEDPSLVAPMNSSAPASSWNALSPGREKRFKTCPLSVSNATHYLRSKLCESQWFYDEWGLFILQSSGPGLLDLAALEDGRFDYLVPHRRFFPELLRVLELRGGARTIQIGVRDSTFPSELLDWPTIDTHHAIDALPLEVVAPSLLSGDTRFHFHKGYDFELVNGFEDGALDLVYIDSVQNYESIRASIARWLPKIKAGGVIAGNNFCRARDSRQEIQRDSWPPGDRAAELSRAPYCGHYLCGPGHCAEEERMRLGQRKPGYGGVVIAVVEALREADMALHVTLDGRQPGAAFQVLEGENPSWWAVK